MKKLFLLCLLFGTVLFSGSLNAQTLNLVQPVPAPFPACQCDSLEITYQILGSDFVIGTDFFVEITDDPLQDFTNADTLDIVRFRAIPSTNVALDTFTTGSKILTVLVPCDQTPLGNFIRITAGNGEISDTNQYNVLNRTLSEIDTIIGGFENPYTGADDWGFCTGDSIVLVAFPHATFFQWKNNGVDIPGETNDTLVVKQSGLYSVDTWVSPSCKTTSEDTLINSFLPRTTITLVSTPPTAYQIDLPSGPFPLDSAQACASSSIVFSGPSTVGSLVYRYTWLTDSITQFGDTVYYQTNPADTFQQVTIDTSVIKNGYGRLWLMTEDGFCVDTSDVYHVFFDETPVASLGSLPFPGLPGVPVLGDVCMKDSVRIAVLSPQEANWEYQWQRANTSAIPFTWFDVTDSTEFDMKVDTNLAPIQTLSYYRLEITTTTPQGDPVCVGFSDTIRVRWFPEYDLTVPAGQPGVNIVGKDSVSICETDSVTVLGPNSPDPFELPYSYQWLTDSIITGGGLDIYPIAGATLQSVLLKEPGNYYLDIDDGICTDRYSVFQLFVDTLARTTISNVPFPSNPSLGTSLDLCQYDSVLITAADTVLPQWNYQWQQLIDGVGWMDMMNDTLPSIVIDSANAVADTSYFRLNTNYNNIFGITTCQFISDSIQVIFYDSPTVSFFPGDSLGVCLNDSVLVVAQSNDAFTYTWQDGILGASRWFSTPGTYTLTTTGINGCITEIELDIFSQQTLADAGPDQTVNSGDIAFLSGTGGTSYRWYADKPLDFNDFLSQDIQVSKLLDENVVSDTIVIYMIATAANGCSGIDSLTIIINNTKDEELINLEKVYNLFTPNSDGFNDVWDINEVLDGRACEIQIMNRWGSTIFEDKAFGGVWDGNDTGGDPVPDGTYYYILSCDKTVILKSAITVIRNE
jgi:gliding motility-associated-like protein